MRRICDSGKWWVSRDGVEVFRGHGRGPAVSYASSLVLVSVFDRQKVLVQVHGPQGVVWSYQEPSPEDAPPDLDLVFFVEESAAVELSESGQVRVSL